MEYRSGMILQRPHASLRPRFLLALALLATAGCAQMHALKSKVGGMFHQDKMVAKIERTPHPSAPAEKTAPVVPLKEIVDKYLQVGRYARGEALLKAYLGAHPDDRAAHELMRQLTADPAKLLGRRSRPYVVQPGESYSTLAARYLGSAMRFLVLARYNGSTNPSLLQAGQTVRVPASAADASTGTGDSPGGRRTIASAASTR